MQEVKKKHNLFRRIAFDVVLLLAGILLISNAPPEESPFLMLMVTKAMLVSAGIIHAHVARRVFFPYIDFAEEQNPVKVAFVGSLYLMGMFCYARGG